MKQMTATEVLEAQKKLPRIVLTPLGLMTQEDCEKYLLMPLVERAADIIAREFIIPQLCGPFGRVMS